MNTAAKLILDGARANGLQLIGDGMIGYKFVPVPEVSNVANQLLMSCFNDLEGLSEWCIANADGPYDEELWNKES